MLIPPWCWQYVISVSWITLEFINGVRYEWRLHKPKTTVIDATSIDSARIEHECGSGFSPTSRPKGRPTVADKAGRINSQSTEHLRDSLRPKNPAAAKRVAVAIINAVKLLERYPRIGRPADGMDDLAFRELLIDFGDSGYVARYRLAEDSVTVLAVRNQRDAGI